MSTVAAEAGPATLDEVTAAVQQMYELFGDLRGQVEALADMVASLKRRPGDEVFRWAELDTDAARAAWERLHAWVSWLLDRYALKEVPRACWWRHGMLVEELTALWLAWQAAYGDQADATAPLVWHEHLDRARDRIRLRLQQQGNCTTGEHHDPVLQPHVQSNEMEFAEFVDADVAVRSPAEDEPADR